MMDVFVATATNTDDGFTEVIGVYSTRKLAQAACQSYLDGSLDTDVEDQDVLVWNTMGDYADVDMFTFNVTDHQVV